MKNRILIFVLAIAGLASAGFASTGLAQAGTPQTSPLPLPPGVEKELASRASNVTEVTLGKSMLSFASKFMNGKDEDDAATKKLIEGLDGIYVRSFEFDAPGQYNAADLEPLRTYLDAGHWTKIVDTKEGKGASSIYVLPLTGDQFGGLAILSTEEKEVSVVLIDGQVSMGDLGKLGGTLGIPDMSTLTAPKAKKKE